MAEVTSTLKNKLKISVILQFYILYTESTARYCSEKVFLIGIMLRLLQTTFERDENVLEYLSHWGKIYCLVISYTLNFLKYTANNMHTVLLTVIGLLTSIGTQINIIKLKNVSSSNTNY